MTGPDNSQAATRPISVAELLAKNGTIGSPPVGGGRRRRRRGKSDAVSVADLTEEIPVASEHEPQDAAVEDDGSELLNAPGEDTVAEVSQTFDVSGNAAVVHDAEPALERASEPAPHRGRDTQPERSHDPRPLRHQDRQQRPAVAPSADQGAESMSPDPIDDRMVNVYQSADVYQPADPDPETAYTDVETPFERGIGDAGYVPDAEEPALLFSGETMADEVARIGEPAAYQDVESVAGDLSDDLFVDDVDAEVLDDVDLDEDYEHEDYQDEDYQDRDYQDEGEYYEGEYYEEPSRGRLILHGLVIAVQSVVAVAFGAGLFLAFDQLWRWNSLVAMVLAILATLGLVAGVWAVRKTEDIASTLIAVGVGLLVTFGPLALMQAG